MKILPIKFTLQIGNLNIKIKTNPLKNKLKLKPKVKFGMDICQKMKEKLINQPIKLNHKIGMINNKQKQIHINMMLKKKSKMIINSKRNKNCKNYNNKFKKKNKRCNKEFNNNRNKEENNNKIY